MFFSRRPKRQQLLQAPLTADQAAYLARQVPLFRRVPALLRPRLEGAVQVLLAEKHFEGCDGVQIDARMKLVVMAQAALLQLGPHADFYPRLDTVLIYPEGFWVDHPREDETGLVSEDPEELAGESWQQGAVILSWADVEQDMKDPTAGYNVVLHEFAHQLDDQTGTADGTPLLADAGLAARWTDAFGPAFERHRKRAGRGRAILFDADAAESPAEFFATAVEIFFTLPRDLKQEYGAIHAVLAEHFGVDPAQWEK